MKKKKLLFRVITFFAILIGLYPLMYGFVDPKYTFLSTKKPEVLLNLVWKACFYIHIGLGGLALFIGWMQFLPKFRSRKPKTHRIVGYIYVTSVLISSIASFYMAFFANYGPIASAGFAILAVIWFTTTLKAVLEIKKGRIAQHQKWMIYSYAATFSAATLRLYLVPLSLLINPGVAYQIIAWLCWVPNIFAAYRITSKNKLGYSAS